MSNTANKGKNKNTTRHQSQELSPDSLPIPLSTVMAKEQACHPNAEYHKTPDAHESQYEFYEKESASNQSGRMQKINIILTLIFSGLLVLSA